MKNFHFGLCISATGTILLFALLKCIDRNGNDDPAKHGDKEQTETEMDPKPCPANDRKKHPNPYWEFMRTNRSVPREWRATDIPFVKNGRTMLLNLSKEEVLLKAVA